MKPNNTTSNRRRRLLLVGVVIAVVVALTAPNPVTAHRGPSAVETTKGAFVTLPGGEDLGFTIEGKAKMMRLRHHTVVHVRVQGLDAKTTYPAHVHDAPCAADPPGGVHYQHKPGDGPRYVNSVNEIWPEVNTNRRGRAHAHAVHGHRARADAQSIVIHYPPDTSIRLACADLS